LESSCPPAKLTSKHAPLEFEQEIYQPVWEFNPAPPIDCPFGAHCLGHLSHRDRLWPYVFM